MEDTTITIEPVEGTADLLCVYPDQVKPQGCYIGLDLRDGFVSAFYNPEIGNGIPMETAHGILRRYPIPLLAADSANQLMKQLIPELSKVRAGAEIVWDGSNQVARLNEAAEQAENKIGNDILEWDADLYWADASEWCAEDAAAVRDMVREWGVDWTMMELDGDGMDDEAPVLIGLRHYLEQLLEESTAR